MNPDSRFLPVAELLQRGLHDRIFTAAQAAWIVGDSSPTILCAGDVDEIPVSESTRFDIASITKVFTASAVLRSAARGQLELDAPLGAYLSCPTSLAAVPLTRLLAHESGLPAWKPFFESIPMEQRGRPESAETVITAAKNAPLSPSNSGTALYSDLGFIILGAMLEALFNKDLSEIIRAEVCAPLDLHIDFRPVGTTAPPAAGEIAATELCPWRGRRLHGEVHDDNAWAMGGIAGHAGLFASASETARFGAVWLRSLSEDAWLLRDLARTSVRRRPSGRALGWDLKSPIGSSAGDFFSDDAFGHLGFTGCSLWMDPKRRIAAALLTNRVYFGRDNIAIRLFRPMFHNTLAECLGVNRRQETR